MKHTSAPIIGAINGVTAVRWKDYAVHMEQAGPDALELDFYHAANDLSEPGRGIERRFIGPGKRRLSMITTNNAVEARVDGGRSGVVGPVVFHKRRNLGLLTMDRVVLELSAHFALAGAQKVASPPVDQQVHLLLDWEEMEKAFVDFLENGREAIVGREEVEILGRALPVVAGEKGCGLISFSFRGNRRLRTLRFSEGSGPLPALQRVVMKHGGILRLSEQRDKTLLCIYLPVYRGGDYYRPHDDHGRR